MSGRLREQTVMLMANVRERPAVSIQIACRLHMERFNFKKLNKLEGEEQYRAEISNTFAALEN
jgi:hypothetical protein